MNRHLHIHIVLCTLGLLFHSGMIRAQDMPSPVNRRPAWAGSFYPGSRQALESKLGELFKLASPKELKGEVRYLIVPHAGYSYSGTVAASGYASIPKDARYKNIFIIASSHREYFEGASVYWTGNYMTPLGEARVNRTLAKELIENNKQIHFLPAAHDREHSIEVQVPFIQYHFAETPPIVPIVMGSSSLAASRDLATALMPYFTPENLFVISSDFSHYPSYQEATSVDRTTCEAILTNDPQQFYNTLRKNSSADVSTWPHPAAGGVRCLPCSTCPGRMPEMDLTPVLYRNSGDSQAGDRDRVVGYWAIAGHQEVHEQDRFLLIEAEKKRLLEISRETLETYLESQKVPELEAGEMTETLRQPAGAFVSLYKHGQLRGCIGNFRPSEPLYKVVQNMSVAASTKDTRFYPVDPSELENISIEISVLTPLRKIDSAEEFQLGRHGIYMTKDGRSGTYLPQVAEQTGWTKEEFLGNCAMNKARIGWDGWKEADLYVYEAIIFKEDLHAATNNH